MEGARIATGQEIDALARRIKARVGRFSQGTGCSTPGMKIRSRGRGRGLARGRGRGPIGIPFGYR